LGKLRNFIRDTKKETPQLEAKDKLVTAKLKDPSLSEDERANLEATRADLQSQLDLNKALLQAKSAAFDVTLFQNGFTIDVDGDPKAYHPDGKSGLDFLGNAGSPGNWWGLVTDTGLPDGHPVVQGPNDPAPGFYICPTSLEDLTKGVNDPSRYVNSSKIPYIELPTRPAQAAGIKLGDVAAVANLANQQVCFAIYAVSGPSSREKGGGSIALAQCLGIPSSPKTGGTSGGIVYKIFPGSGNGKPRTLEEINREGDRLFKAWGGNEQMLRIVKHL